MRRGRDSPRIRPKSSGQAGRPENLGRTLLVVYAINLYFCGACSKKFEPISPKTDKTRGAGGIPPRPPFRPPRGRRPFRIGRFQVFLIPTFVGIARLRRAWRQILLFILSNPNLKTYLKRTKLHNLFLSYEQYKLG